MGLLAHVAARPILPEGKSLLGSKVHSPSSVFVHLFRKRKAFKWGHEARFNAKDVLLCGPKEYPSPNAGGVSSQPTFP